MTLGSSLSNGQTIQSANGLFQFGLLSLTTGSSSVYLGVSYASIQTSATVWIANRQQAVTQAATCSLTSDGRVILTDNGTNVWEIGGSGLNVSELALMDTGNLELRSSNSSIIWQSFDDPGNTWLPTMSLGRGKKLVSWLTPNDPSMGPYSLSLGSADNFLLKYNGSMQYWDSGTWTGSIFANVPEMTTSNFIFNFTFNSSGFTWYVYANAGADYNISRFVLEYDGLVQESSFYVSQGKWNAYWSKPDNPCDVIRLCGQNSICSNSLNPNCECPSPGFQATDQQEWDQTIFYKGCETKSPLNCSSTQGSNDGFISINQTSFDWSFTASMAMVDQGTCRDRCLANCSCKGFYFNGGQSGNCSLFSEALYDGIGSSSESGTFYLRVAAKDLVSNQPASGQKALSIGSIVAIVVGAVAILVMATVAILWGVQKMRRLAAAKTPEAGLRAFSYAELQAATKNFKEKLGSGGFGTVYRGVVGGEGGGAAAAVAVKKLHRLDEGEKQFRAEVRTIGTIQHVNLVRLLGFCSEGKHRLLVYEMADNGSLDGILFHNNHRAAALTWQNRYNTALGAARGVAYLHESCRECIIHCDIKPENILLNASYIVKVADFGLAKLVGREFSHVLTTLRGTRGYLAPEWIAGMPITAKADVYSFGMTMLELISGRRNIHNDHDILATTPHISFFPIWAAQLIHQPHADLLSLLDPRLQGNANMEELQRLAYCAIWCIQDNEDSRPSMGKVVQILEGGMPISPPPIPTSLQALTESDSHITKSSSLFSQK